MALVDGARVWTLHATYGFPLDMSLPLLWDRGFVPTWDRLFAAAARDGVGTHTLMRRILSAIGDAYPPEMAATIRTRLADMIKEP